RPDEAIAVYQEATCINKDDPKAHYNLGLALFGQRRLDEAIAAYQKAVRLKPDWAQAHLGLGNALGAKGDLTGAIAASEKAIALQPHLAEAHCNLGHALRLQGEFRRALVALRRGDELGSKNPGWPYPSARWVQECERLVDLEGRLATYLEGKATPVSAK